MCLPCLDSDKFRQWLETGFVALMFGLLLHVGSPHVTVPESYGFLWRGLSASFLFVAKGAQFF